MIAVYSKFFFTLGVTVLLCLSTSVVWSLKMDDLVTRDGIFYTNDHVIFGIDTYGDGRYYVGFGANPLGSILDYKEGSRGEAERSYNVEFEAKSQLTEYGYDVELKIPFSSLNYPDKEINKWKVLFERKLYNKGVESRYSSNKVIAGAGCNICQSQYFYLPGKVSQKSKNMFKK